MPAHIISGFQRKKLPNQQGIRDGLLSKFSDLLELAQKVGHSPLHILDAALSYRLYDFCSRHLLDTQRPPVQRLTDMQFRFLGPMQKRGQ